MNNFKLLVIGPSWVGDMVMAQALFKTILEQMPNSQIDVIAPSWCLDVTKRMPEINKGIIEPKSNPSLEIWSKGESKVQRVLYHVHFGDWVSVHLGEMRNVDLVEVKVIDYLKGELAKK